MDYLLNEEDFVHLFIESKLMIESNLNQIKLIRLLDEYTCLESGNYNGLCLLNESIIGDIKNFIIKIWNGIVKMWNKFVHKAEEIFNLEKKFLEDNKDVILKKKPIKAEISIYEYNHDVIAKPVISKFNEKTILSFDIKRSLEKLGIPVDTTKVSEGAKILFRGDKPKTKLSSELNFAEMYNYCYSFRKLKDTIRNDLKELESTKESILLSIKVENKKIKEKTSTNESVFSSILESYITEVDINTKVNTKAPTNNPVNNKDNTVNKDTTIGANIKNIDGNKPEEKDISKMANKSNDSGEAYEELERKVKEYYDLGGQLLSAKLNVSMSAFKDYMKILRWHVDNFTNKEKIDTDRKNTQTAKDYSEETPL